MIPALCLLFTAILVYFTTLNIDNIEFAIIVCCLILIIWILSKPVPPKIPTIFQIQEYFEDAVWNKVDVQAFSQLATLPTQVANIIKPPIEKMINNSYTEDKYSTIDKLTHIDDDPYVEEEDTYVGKVTTVVQQNNMGLDETVNKFVLEESKFESMKVEYKLLNSMLTLLREGDPDLYKEYFIEPTTTEEPTS